MRLVSMLVLLSLVWGPGPARAQASARRPFHTFSIVAVDSATGQIGVAVQSHWFSVGSAVAWAEPGVGAVATQSFIDPAYGPRGLYLMRSGTAAKPSPNDTRVAVDAGKGQPEQRPAASWQPPQRARAATRDFLQENAAREGVVSLPSGLQYKVLKRGDGTGRTPQLTDTVAVRYRGRLPRAWRARTRLT